MLSKLIKLANNLDALGEYDLANELDSIIKDMDDTKCDECSEPMPLDVQRSAAGYYIGRFCNKCGPYSRDSGYFKTKDDAQKELNFYKNKSMGKI